MYLNRFRYVHEVRVDVSVGALVQLREDLCKQDRAVRFLLYENIMIEPQVQSAKRA